VGFNRPQSREVSFNASYQVGICSDIFDAFTCSARETSKSGVGEKGCRVGQALADNVAANGCCKRKTWVSTGLNQERCPSTLPTKLVSEETFLMRLRAQQERRVRVALGKRDAESVKHWLTVESLVESLTNEMITTRNMSSVNADCVSPTRSQFKRAVTSHL
jgi:hypothetical protein